MFVCCLQGHEVQTSCSQPVLSLHKTKTMFAIIDDYQIDVKVTYKEQVNAAVKRNVQRMYGNAPREGTYDETDDEDPDQQEEQEEEDSLRQTTTRSVNMKIMDPVTPFAWMYMCEKWRKKLDFVFQRADGWTNDCKVQRFNDTYYVQHHNILDWHDFILLPNGTMLYQYLVVRDADQQQNNDLLYITNVAHEIPSNIRNATTRAGLQGFAAQTFWHPTYAITFRRMTRRANDLWSLSRREHRKELTLEENYERVAPEVYQGKIVVVATGHNAHRVGSLERPQLQHPRVAANQPFMFAIMGSDSYHHTNFTGKNDMDTHGWYMWVGNFEQRMQFDKSCTWVIAQAPSIVPLIEVGSRVYKHLEKFMREGALIWHEGQLIHCGGMVSHQIADMLDRNLLQRRRGASKWSESDGMLWQGYEAGIGYPDNVDDLMQAGCICPGPYRLKVWQFLNKVCVTRGLWDIPPPKYGKSMSLSTKSKDLYNEAPLASTLKSTIEINHTAILGCLVKILSIEWTNLHKVQKFNQMHTREVMNAVLASNFDHINGMRSSLMRPTTEMLTFNQMQKGWAKMIELMIALPRTINWHGNFAIVMSLIRLTGTLHLCDNENQRLRLREIAKPILDRSFVPKDPIHFCTLTVFLTSQ